MGTNRAYWDWCPSQPNSAQLLLYLPRWALIHNCNYKCKHAKILQNNLNVTSPWGSSKKYWSRFFIIGFKEELITRPGDHASETLLFRITCIDWKDNWSLLPGSHHYCKEKKSNFNWFRLNSTCLKSNNLNREKIRRKKINHQQRTDPRLKKLATTVRNK